MGADARTIENALIMPEKNMISVRMKSVIPRTPFEMTLGSPRSSEIRRTFDEEGRSLMFVTSWLFQAWRTLGSRFGCVLGSAAAAAAQWPAASP